MKQRPDPLLMEHTSFPRLTSEQEQALIERARSGEDVRDQVILSLQRRVFALAVKYAQPEEQEDLSDLVNSANLALLKHYQRALKHPNPYAYLLRTARSTMINYYHGYGEHAQRERLSVLSLEGSLSADGTPLTEMLSSGQHQELTNFLPNATCGLLLQAIAALPEKQRIVIQRHYGFGQAPESLNTIKEEHPSKRSRSIDAHYQHNKALAALRTSLAEQFPQYTQGDTL